MMKALTDTLELFAPPQWLMFSLAGALAAVLMVALVATMEDNIKRGEALREGQRVGAVRQALSTGADAVADARQRQFQQGGAAALTRVGFLQDQTQGGTP